MFEKAMVNEPSVFESLKFDCNWGSQSKMKTRMANSVDPDGTAPSHRDLYIWQKCVYEMCT